MKELEDLHYWLMKQHSANLRRVDILSKIEEMLRAHNSVVEPETAPHDFYTYDKVRDVGTCAYCYESMNSVDEVKPCPELNKLPTRRETAIPQSIKKHCDYYNLELISEAILNEVEKMILTDLLGRVKELTEEKNRTKLALQVSDAYGRDMEEQRDALRLEVERLKAWQERAAARLDCYREYAEEDYKEVDHLLASVKP